MMLKRRRPWRTRAQRKRGPGRKSIARLRVLRMRESRCVSSSSYAAPWWRMSSGRGRQLLARHVTSLRPRGVCSSHPIRLRELCCFRVSGKTTAIVFGLDSLRCSTQDSQVVVLWKPDHHGSREKPGSQVSSQGEAQMHCPPLFCFCFFSFRNKVWIRTRVDPPPAPTLLDPTRNSMELIHGTTLR